MARILGQEKMMKKFLCATSLLVSSLAFAATALTGATKINQINSYENFPNGDTVLQVDSPHSSCSGGYWLQMNDIGFKKNMALLTMAFQSQGNVVIYADTTSLWGHSPSPVCLISQVILVR